MKQTDRRDIKLVGEKVDADYVTLEVALLSTGFSKERLLKWCEERNIPYLKRHNHWMIHKLDLTAALQQDLSNGAA